MSALAQDMAIAFAVTADRQGLTVEAGHRLAEELADAVVDAAEDRSNYAPRERSASGEES